MKCSACGQKIEENEPYFHVTKPWKPEEIVGKLCKVCGKAASSKTSDSRITQDTHVKRSTQ